MISVIAALVGLGGPALAETPAGRHDPAANVPIPAVSSSSVAITPGSPSDHVQVILPDLGAKVFVRLKVTP